jgi:hypothetical protein
MLSLDTKEVSRPFGENLGYIQYSPGGHMVVFLQKGDPKRPTAFPFSDSERVEMLNGIIGAYAGTYSVDENKVTHHVVASWWPNWIGSDQVRYIEINAKNLTIKTAPLTSGLTGKQIVSTLTFERVE